MAYTQLQSSDLRGFDKGARALILEATEEGWKGRISSKNSCLMIAPDGTSTMSIPPALDSKRSAGRNARAEFKRWLRGREVKKPEPKVAEHSSTEVISRLDEKSIEAARSVMVPEVEHEEVPTNQPQEDSMEEEKKGGFVMYEPPVKQARVKVQRAAHVSITQVGTIYLSKAAMAILGMPDRVNISVNQETAEMMIWADKHGNMTVRRRTKQGAIQGKTGYVGASDLIDQFDLPRETRWEEVPGTSGPGRILVSLTDTIHTEEKE